MNLPCFAPTRGRYTGWLVGGRYSATLASAERWRGDLGRVSRLDVTAGPEVRSTWLPILPNNEDLND
jgi:hypothetical protein